MYVYLYMYKASVVYTKYMQMVILVYMSAVKVYTINMDVCPPQGNPYSEEVGSADDIM